MTRAERGVQGVESDRILPARMLRRLFVFLLISVSLLRVWFAGTLPLTGDEAYHWEWSRHLAAGYYDHPPVTAYIIRATTALLGTASELGVRFGAIVLMACLSIVVYILGRRMARDAGVSLEGSEQAGWIAGVLALIVPIFAGLGLCMSTDPSVVFFCSLSLLVVYIALTQGGWLSWLAVGVVVGLSLLSKFLCIFTFAGLFVFLVFSPDDRKWFLRPQPYVAALVAAAVFSPFLMWNYSHDWVTFKSYLVTRQSSNEFAPEYFPLFLLSQVIALSPIVFTMGIAGLGKALKFWRREKDRGTLYLLCAAGVPLLYFLLVSFRRRVGLHWPACGWISVIVLLPLLHARGKLSLFWMRIMLWSCLAMTILMHVAASVPPDMLQRTQARFVKDDKKPRFEDERYGWREMGLWVDAAKTWMREDQENKPRGVFLMTGQYRASAALSFYIPGHPEVHLWAPIRTHGENYRLWDDFPSLHLQDAVYLSKSEDEIVYASEILSKHFTYVGAPERLSIKVDGTEVRSFYLVKCFIYDGVAPDFGAAPGREGAGDYE